jgi:glycosyltransferase involved in cell wall biosynthesis
MNYPSHMPAISVLMPAYNSGKYIAASINSILAQTFIDIELIILNDGSVDDTEIIVAGFKDDRIRYFKNDGNRGLAYTRNKLVELSTGEFLAFQDSDDLSEKNRLEVEFKFLQANPEMALVSGSFAAIDEHGDQLGSGWNFELSGQALPVHLLYYNPIATSSVLIRNYPVCEDFDLWTRVLQKYSGRVLPEILTRYRVYDASICKQQPDDVIKYRNQIIQNQLGMYFPGLYSPDDALIQASLADFSIRNSPEDLTALKNWIVKLKALNDQYRHFDQKILGQVIYERILKKFLRLSAYNFSVYRCLQEIRKITNPALTWELRKKEMAILAFSLAGKKFISTN